MKRSALPIENLPAETPRCPWCNRKLRPVVNELGANGKPIYDASLAREMAVRRVFVRWNAYDNLFDRLNCARAFAVASYNAGCRRTFTGLPGFKKEDL